MQNQYTLMRHGESLANRKGLIVSAPENALNDYGLTSKGADQVISAALKSRIHSDTLIVSSDYRRAIETAEIVHSVVACKHDIVRDERIRERFFGDWELEDHRHYEDVWQNDLASPTSTDNNVEPVLDTLARAQSLIESLEADYTNRSILLVSHGDVLQILLAHYHRLNPRFHRSLSAIGNAEVRSLAKLELANKSTAA
ncbi:fructose 1,6-bisphosphatase [Arenicella chitinivorans]|uniref:Fructose 1,6-bisphosphatase n=1 Tax=Arenicella chitinivorans TaxID=1329800 RepID=A0A918RZE5_9GAMM|nr:histidine phosphatase family protein [Arenicella chitinivorans]GHA17072.1 fructose 1,6-bisphosphatase [Arenicella chitinivorans]